MPIKTNFHFLIALIALQLGQVAYAQDDAIDVRGGMFDRDDLGTSTDQIGIEPVLDGPAESIGIPDLPPEPAPAEDPKPVRKRRSKAAGVDPAETAEKEKPVAEVKAPEKVINDFSDASPAGEQAPVGEQATSKEIVNHAEGVITRVKELQKAEAAKKQPIPLKKNFGNSDRWAKGAERKKEADATKMLQKRLQELKKSIEAPTTPARKPLSKRS